MKKIRKIHAVKISEDRSEMALTYHIHNNGLTTLNVSSIAINRRNLYSFRHELYKLFGNMHDLYIFEITLPHVVNKQIIRRINQYLPKQAPAFVLSKKESSGNFLKSTGTSVQLLLNKPQGPREQKELHDTIANLWYPIVFSGLS